MSTELFSTRTKASRTLASGGSTVCIVTPGYLASTPRAVREADALHAAGYRVVVLSTQGDLDVVRAHDEALAADKGWIWKAVRWSRRRSEEAALYYTSSFWFSLARRLGASWWRIDGVAETAETRLFSTLAREAAAERADLYIGHYPGGLAAAARAAHAVQARFGYDAEDLHTAEQSDATDARAVQRRIDFLERKYLPLAAYSTASSAGIGDALANRYGIPPPMVVHNAYALADRAQLDGATKDRIGHGLSVYWFSQTVGADRGLDDAVRAIGLLGHDIELHIRGAASSESRRQIDRLARDAGVSARVHVHDLVPPSELLSRAVEHDVGLALERPTPLNKAICASNKLFLYLLGGLAIGATDVPGQRRILADCADAGFLYEPGDVASLAAHLDRWRRDPAALRRAKSAAFEAASTRWNWEAEARKLVETVASVLDTSAPVRASA